MLLTSIVDPDSFESGSGSFQVNPEPLLDPVFGSRVLMTKKFKKYSGRKLSYIDQKLKYRYLSQVS
jgi:hypothetical protein